MKVKRLKDVIYTYNSKFKEYPFNLEVETNDAQQKGIIDLTKREFLALIKWGIGEMALTQRQANKIEAIAHMKKLDATFKE